MPLKDSNNLKNASVKEIKYLVLDDKNSFKQYAKLKTIECSSCNSYKLCYPQKCRQAWHSLKF